MRHNLKKHEVIVVSDEYFKILNDIPEAAEFSSAVIDGKTLEGMKVIFEAETLPEVTARLPELIRAHYTGDNHLLVVIKEANVCFDCANDAVGVCPHFDINVHSGRMLHVDVKRALQSTNKTPQ